MTDPSQLQPQPAKKRKAELAGELANVEMEVRQQERGLANAKSNATGGAVGALIGIVLLFFWPLGALLLVGGVLAYLTGVVTRSSSKTALENAEKRVVELKAQLAAM